MKRSIPEQLMITFLFITAIAGTVGCVLFGSDFIHSANGNGGATGCGIIGGSALIAMVKMFK